MARAFIFILFVAFSIVGHTTGLPVPKPHPCPAAEPVAEIEKLRVQGMSEVRIVMVAAHFRITNRFTSSC